MLDFLRQVIGTVIVVVLLQGCSTTSRFDAAKSEIVKIEEIERISGKAEMAYQAGQYQKSEGMWLRVVEIDPKNVRALYRLGNTNFRLGNVEIARDFYEKTVEVSPRYSKAHYNLAVINLVLAGQHFQFYSATTDPTTDLENVTDILGEISRFKASQNKTKPTRLERLAEQLSGRI